MEKVNKTDLQDPLYLRIVHTSGIRQKKPMSSVYRLF